MIRDATTERRCIVGAVEGHSPALVSTALSLYDFAAERAEPGGVHVTCRDFGKEFHEEMADAANYLIWGMRAGKLPQVKARRALALVVAAVAALDAELNA